MAALAVLLAVAATLAPPTTSEAPASGSPLHAALSRGVLGVIDLTNGSGTLAVRLKEASLDIEALHGNWVTGLGFEPPEYHYVLGLREGSIRNDDLGSLPIIMTMGLIGLGLAYLPPVWGLFYLLRRRRGYVQFGGAMYLTAALVCSVTLQTLDSPAGLFVLAPMLVLCLNGTELRALGAAAVTRSSTELPNTK